MPPDDASPPSPLPPGPSPGRSGPAGWGRLWPLALLAAAAVLAYAFGLHRWLSFESLGAHRSALAGFVAGSPVLAAFLYVAA